MDSVTVALADRTYRIDLGDEVLSKVGPIARELGLGTKVAVVTNPTVGGLYYAPVHKALEAGGFSVCKVEIPDGEEFKNIETLKEIYDCFVDGSLDRGSFVVALGGGVVGDIAGFAAATYLRGIPVIQVPTTLLAQVDSSVGGKTGINHESGKNLIGAFYQPVSVLIDVATLSTLPERVYLSGLAEVIKYGITLDAPLFDFIHANAEKLLAREKKSLLKVITRSCTLKSSIVAQDEKETGLRAVLNYGHTFGHAVETLTAYRDYTHGEAVAIGMAQAAKVSEAMGYSGKAETDRIVALLERLGLPTGLPQFNATAYKNALLHDKKIRDSGLSFVFNKQIGQFDIDRISDIDLLLKIAGIGD